MQYNAKDLWAALSSLSTLETITVIQPLNGRPRLNRQHAARVEFTYLAKFFSKPSMKSITLVGDYGKVSPASYKTVVASQNLSSLTLASSRELSSADYERLIRSLGVNTLKYLSLVDCSLLTPSVVMTSLERLKKSLRFLELRHMFEANTVLNDFDDRELNPDCDTYLKPLKALRCIRFVGNALTNNTLLNLPPNVSHISLRHPNGLELIWLAAALSEGNKQRTRYLRIVNEPWDSTDREALLVCYLLVSSLCTLILCTTAYGQGKQCCLQFQKRRARRIPARYRRQL